MADRVPVFRFIPVAMVDVGAQMLRSEPEDDSLVELAEDIAKNGLRQPIGVEERAEGRFQLLWGSRRLAAHVRLRFAKILARVDGEGSNEVRAAALGENVHRRQLTFAEEVRAVQDMVEIEGKSIEAISAVMSKGRSWVLNRLMVPTLPEFMREPLLEGHIGIAHVEILAKLGSEGAQRYLLSQTIQCRWNVAQLKDMARIYEVSPGLEDVPGLVVASPRSPIEPIPVVWRCEACGEDGPIDRFQLVRVCKNGCRSEPDKHRAVAPSRRGDGVEDPAD